MLKRILFLFLFISKLVFGQYSLDDFVNRAVENSPVLKEYHYQQTGNQIQQKINRAENSAFHLSLTGDYLFTPYFNNHGNLVTTNPSPQAIGYDINLFDGGLYSAQLNLVRNIFNGRLVKILDRQIQIQDENCEYGLSLERHNLKKEVTDQYLSTLRAERLIQLTQEVITNLEKQLGLTEEMMEEGYSKTQDYLLLQIEVKNQTIYLRDAQQQYKSNLLQLYSLCGIQDTSIVEISSVILEPDTPKTMSSFTRKYVLDSLAAITEQTLFETKYRPQLQAFFNTGLNAIQLQNIQRKFGMSAGLNLSLPLFDGNQKSLTRQKNIITLQTISTYKQFSEHNITLQRKDLQSQIESLQKNIESLTDQIQDYKKLLKISVKQLQQGNMSMIDYLSLLRNFTELRKNMIDVEINYQLEINNYNYWNW